MVNDNDKELSLQDFIAKIRESSDYTTLPTVSTDQEEDMIIEDSGVPPGVIVAMKAINEVVGGMITIRTGTPPLDGQDLQAKPLLVHAKCGNRPLGILSGLICTDPALSKIYENNTQNIESATKAITEDLAQTDIQQLALKLTLREILGKTSLETTDKEAMIIDKISTEGTSSFLVLKYNQQNGFGPNNFQGEFRINLDPLKLPLNEQSTVQDIKTALHALVKSGSTTLDNEFLIEYKSSSENSYQPLKVLGINNQKITGDVDLDYYSIPMGLPTYAYQEINTLNSIEQQKRLLNDTEMLLQSSRVLTSPLHELYNKLNKAYQENHNKSQTQELSGLNDFFKDGNTIEYFAKLTGIISPVEFLQSMAINILYNINNTDNIISMYNPIQHGAENRSPHKGNTDISSGDDGKRLHIIYDKDAEPPKSEVFYTFNDQQRANLCLTKGFLENNFVHINPASKMQIWGPVVEKQLLLDRKRRPLGKDIGPTVSEQTLQAYNNCSSLFSNDSGPKKPKHRRAK